jgi:glycosyltransferase involved in cell wall biosynthesis
MTKPFSISFVSSYVPRQCGIAVFTNDLVTAINEIPNSIFNDNHNINGGYSINVTALNDIPEGYKYPSEVKFEIKDKSVNDFKEAAYYLNLSNSDVINIQHEFGLYGGEAGSNILYLIERLNKPFVTTLHTILQEPSEEQLKVLQDIGEKSSFLIVQSVRSRKMLEKIYKIPPEKIKFIPHGAPDVPFLDPAYYKDKFQLSEKKVILTFGLLGPGKGLEDGINALAKTVKSFPDVMYIILGATHPNVRRQFGEAYRHSLENLVNKHGLENNVMFINRFVDAPELLEFLLMSDMYLSPYHNMEQIVSGTLTYAVACGKAVIATPYWHAQELLANERGVLVPPKDPEALSDVLTDLLKDENKRNRIRKNAYDAGRKLIWPHVGRAYSEIFHIATEGFKRATKLPIPSSKEKALPILPEINLTHLRNLTDSTGIFQHATYSIPNPNEGYCTDDNCRALLVAVMNQYMMGDDSVNKLINRYLTFIHYSFNPESGLFRNFMSYERAWLEDAGSEDCNGRVIFVLGYIIKNTPSYSTLSMIKHLFDQSIKNMDSFKSPRSLAYITVGSIFYLNKFAGARDIKKICKNSADKILEYYTYTSSKEWQWFEDSVTYDNARLPQALLMAGQFLNNKTYITAGLESLNWLYEILYDKEKKCLSLIGNDGWYFKGKPKAKFDQQPMEIPALIDACYQAYLITRDDEWINRLGVAFSWFLGNNDRQEPLCDFTTGGCYDGLTSSMVNQNQGAESTISWLLSLHRVMVIRQELQIE